MSLRQGTIGSSITKIKSGNTSMTITNMTRKAQVTIPKRAREATGLKPGAKVKVAVENGKVVLSPVGKAPKGPFAKIRGTLKDTMTTDQIMALLRGD